MKLMHLADLHIGKSVHEFSMIEDQIYILDQIVHYADTEKPNVILIAGDVYDKQTPGAEAVRVFDDFLTALAKRQMPVLLVSGNHDSPERLTFASRIMAEQRLYFYGVFDGSMRRVELQDEYGTVAFHMLPFVKPSVVRRFYPDAQIESYQDAVRVVLEHTELDTNKRNVLLMHQYVVSPAYAPVLSESENLAVGGIDCVDASLFDGFDYVALGHLHAPQKAGAGHIRYAGSPLKYSKSEWRHKKSVTMVDLKEKGTADISLLPLLPLRDMRCPKGRLAELTGEEAVAAANKEDYLHIRLTDEEEIVNAYGKLRSHYPHIMSLEFEREAGAAEQDAQEWDAAGQKTPEALFTDLFLEQNGTALSESQHKIVRGLLTEDME